MRQIISSISKAWSSLLGSPAYLLTVVLSLGVSLGALVSVFGINSILLWKPLPYPEQDRLAIVSTELLKQEKVQFSGSHTLPMVDHLMKHQDQFESLAITYFNTVNANYRGDSHRLSAAYVSNEYFPLLGASFKYGSDFKSQTDPLLPYGVLSYKLWTKKFNSDPNLLGRSISINNVTFKLVGILSPSFEEPEIFNIGRETDIWLSWQHAGLDDDKNKWGLFYDSVKLIALLKKSKSSSIQNVARKLTDRYAAMYHENNLDASGAQEKSLKVTLVPLAKYLIGDSYVSSLLMLAGMLGLLAIVVANVTNLILARSAQKNRDYAVFASLGAKPKHIYQHILIECGVLMSVSGVLALTISLAASPYLIDITKDSFPRVSQLSFGFSELIFLISVCTALSFLFAFLTYKQTDYRHLVLSLKSSGKGNGKQVSKKTRRFLIMSQVIIATLMLTSTLTILTQSLKIWFEPVTVDVRDTYLTRIQLKGGEKLNDEASTQMMIQLRDELRKANAFEEVSFSSRWPYSSRWGLTLSKEPGDQEEFNINMTPIDESWLSLFNVELLKGRNFTEYDVKSQAKLILVNESAAKTMSPEKDIVGQRFYWSSLDSHVEVVGMIKDVKIPGTEQKPLLYTAINSELFLVIKSKKDQTLSDKSFSEYLRQANPSLELGMFMGLEPLYNKRRAPEKTMIAMSLGLSLITIAIVAMGLYGILSYQVNMRRLEFGIRMSLGAKASHIIRQCFMETLMPSMIGVSFSLVSGIIIFINFASQIETVIMAASTAWILPFLVSLGLILCLILLSCVIPLKPIVSMPPVNSLRY